MRIADELDREGDDGYATGGCAQPVHNYLKRVVDGLGLGIRGIPCKEVILVDEEENEFEVRSVMKDEREWQ